MTLMQVAVHAAEQSVACSMHQAPTRMKTINILRKLQN
jgi:hypothetical protein